MNQFNEIPTVATFNKSKICCNNWIYVGRTKMPTA